MVHLLASQTATTAERMSRVGENARDADHSTVGAAYEMVGVAAAEKLMISDLTLWWEDDDPVTAEKYSNLERYGRATASTAGVILFVVGPAFGKGASATEEVILAEVVPEATLGSQSIIVGVEAKPVISEYVATMTARSRTGDLLDDVVVANYQRYYNEAWLERVARFNQGKITVPAGMSWKTVLGREVDGVARRRLRNFLKGADLSEGPGNDFLVNRYLRDPAGSGYRIPDVRLIQSNTILDGTIGSKGMDSQQIMDFIRFSGGRVIIIRPQVGPMFGGL
jgi:hypothetical protein